MKKLAALIFILIALIGGYFGYQHLQAQELVKTATPSIKEASLRTKQVADFITAPSNVTFAETFKKTNETVDKIGELIITIESQNRQANPEAIAAAVDYLKASQALARSINAEVRIRLESRQASASADAALEDLKSSNEYTRKYAKERLDKSIKDMKSSLEKMIEQAQEITKAIASTQATREIAAQFFPVDALLTKETLKELEDYFAEEEKKAE